MFLHDFFVLSRCLLFLWVLFPVLTIASPSVKNPPHIIFMLVDDLGWNDVGWHDKQIHTPKLDLLVRTSIRLTNYYVYRFCSPSRSTFQTGRYPWHIGQQTRMNLNPTPGIACGINLNYTFMPGVLKKAGYTTWALGKWHLGYLTNKYTPTYRGFDHYLGYYSGAEEHFTHTKGGEGYTAFDLANNTENVVQPCRGSVGPNGTYSSYLYGNETLRLLHAHDPNKPLYIYLAWNNVHAPCEAPSNYVAANMHIQNNGRRNFASMMSALDDQLTAVVDTLKNKGMWDNTVLIFTTDNGGNLGGNGNNYPLRGGKYTFWQGGVRGVSFVSSPLLPMSFQGKTWSGAAHAADWYTTIAALAGVSTLNTGPLPPDGVNLWPSLLQNSSSPRSEVVLQIMSTNAANAVHQPIDCGIEIDLCHSQQANPTPSPARPYPMTAPCDTSDASQRWSVDVSDSTMCELSSHLCFNVQKSETNIILFAVSSPPTTNERFHITNGTLRSDLRPEQCIVSPALDAQLVLMECLDKSEQQTWTYDNHTQQLAVHFSNKSMLCISRHEPDPELELGVLIQGQWKLIAGYPGWKDAWDGWIQPPTLHNGWIAQTEHPQSSPNNSSLCAKNPCLFNIMNDPTEHTDLATKHPDIVEKMMARVLELLKGEVTVAESGLCPTSTGSKPDPKCKEKAMETGFWEPWLNDTAIVNYNS